MKTTTVKLVEKTQIGVDDFGVAQYEERYIEVKGCLVGQPSAEDAANTLAQYGKHISYMVGVPKGDTHKWYDTDVIIWGERYHTIGYPQTGILENIPLNWGQNVRVERYEGV